MQNQESPQPVNVEVLCDVEDRVVGHLVLIAGVRPKVIQPELALNKFRPLEERYRLTDKSAIRNHYWHCPHCGGRLCLRGVKKTGEAYPPGHPKAGQVAPHLDSVLAPIVLGRTQVQVG